jgi:L-lactate dehydrogenase (cytochrome)
MAKFPRWWANVLTTPPLTFSSLKSTGGTVAELMTNVFDPSITVADVRWLRANWPGKLVIKGVQHADDAQMLLDEGVDALLLSNHGGRQLDRAVVPLELLPEVRQRVGPQAQVLIDGGAMSGADVVAAIGLGATAVMMGRAYLYGLMAGGEPGVRRAATIVKQEVEQTMRLLGVQRLDQLEPGMVRWRREHR